MCSGFNSLNLFNLRLVNTILYGWVAQQVEQQTENLRRVDSISAPATTVG